MRLNFKLSEIKYETALEKEFYKQEIDNLQNEARIITHYNYKKQRTIVLVFEGWDAAGKGGTIRRLTSLVDPRLYYVHSIAAPNEVERSHNYLWRFWTKLPPAGYMAIFDRSWYGRVLVERVEGFAKPEEWGRAYEEIAQFEEDLVDSGAIIIKYWLQVSPEEQLARFTARKDDPLRRWKLTDEDWRNRDKWPLYETAAEEMFEKNHRSFAPWYVIPANDKYYARIMVLKVFNEIIKRELGLPKNFK